MSVFRPGDRVRTIAPSWGVDLVPVGSVGTVRPSKVHGVIPVAFDHHHVGDGTGAWSMFDRQLEHLHPAPVRFVRWPFVVLIPRISRAFARAYAALVARVKKSRSARAVRRMRANRRKRVLEQMKADLARRHRYAQPLCPALVARHPHLGPCLSPLPCARHDIPNAQIGFLLCGSYYVGEEVTARV